MRTHSECLHEAVRCERYAAQTKSDTARAVFIRLATTWRKIAAAGESPRRTPVAANESESAPR